MKVELQPGDVVFRRSDEHSPPGDEFWSMERGSMEYFTRWTAPGFTPGTYRRMQIDASGVLQFCEPYPI